VRRALLHQEIVLGAWSAYSRAAPWPGSVPPHFYAEKYGGYAEDLVSAGIAFRWIDLVRDPRETWCSVLAFDAKRGYFGFGRREGQTEEEYLPSFLSAVRRRLDEMTSGRLPAPTITVRYEDLVTKLSDEADRLGAWLGTGLEADADLVGTSGLGHHRTTDSADDSIGRWRTELPADVSRHIEAELAPYLDRYGYLLASRHSVDDTQCRSASRPRG
jgi:hypothetical protein